MKKAFFLLLLAASLLMGAESTPSDVYAQVAQIKKEIDIIKAHFKISRSVPLREINVDVQPRHVWQKTYEIFVKINIFRGIHGFSLIEPVNIQPKLNVNPILPYEQSLRILEELRILKYRLDIKQKVTPVKKYYHKYPKDVFAFLMQVSQEMDILNGNGFTPSYVFGENMRVYDDINAILSHLNIDDNTIPAAKEIDATPNDTYRTALRILKRIRNIKALVGIQSIDFTAFRKKSATPSDVFSITELIISEIQVIKAYVGLQYYITPAAGSYFDKTPADVDQLMSWNLRKLALIRGLSVEQ